MMDPTRGTVLALLAHPDDTEFLCGGTLALLTRRGWKVHVATATPGDLGSAELPPHEIAAIRRAEGAKAAQVIGGRYHCLELMDLRVFYGEDGLRRVTSLLRRVRPDLVITHSPSCYLLDHEETSRLTRAGCFAAPAPHAVALEEDKAPPLERIPFLYYTDVIEGLDLFGNRVPASIAIDTTSVFETKLEMLACHASQREWLRRQHGMDDYLETARTWSRERGVEAGYRHAEVFRQHLGHGYPRHNLLGQVLADVAKEITSSAG